MRERRLAITREVREACAQEARVPVGERDLLALEGAELALGFAAKRVVVRTGREDRDARARAHLVHRDTKRLHAEEQRSLHHAGVRDELAPRLRRVAGIEEDYEARHEVEAVL